MDGPAVMSARRAGPSMRRRAGQGPVPAAPALLILIALALSFVCATNFSPSGPVFPAEPPALAAGPLSGMREVAPAQASNDSCPASAIQNQAAPVSVPSCASDTPIPASAREQTQPVQLADAPPLSGEMPAPGTFPGAAQANRARAPNAPSLTQLSISRT